MAQAYFLATAPQLRNLQPAVRPDILTFMAAIATSPEQGQISYTFRVVVEPDEDAWHAYCPALVRHGGATWGRTREEALANIAEVVQLVVESLREHGEPVPEGSHDMAQVSGEPIVSVTV